MAPKEPSEAEIIFNRANVALARSQRLIQSWLPARSAIEIANAKSDEESAKEEEESFKPVPESLGVGAKAPEGESDGSFFRKKLSSNDKSSEQSLGKNAVKGRKAGGTAPGQRPAADHRATKPMAPKTTQVEDESDKEEGRASAFKSKSQKRKRAPLRDAKPSADHTPESDATPGADEDTHVEVKSLGTPVEASEDSEEDDKRPSKKRAATYLDELSAQKAKKKSKKKKV